MISLWCWTFLFTAPFGLSACHQAAEPGWKFPLAAAAIATLVFGCIVFGLPEEMFLSQAHLDRHPDQLRFRALVWVILAALVCLAGAIVGRVFKGRTSPARIGLRSFLTAFIGLNVIALRGAFS